MDWEKKFDQIDRELDKLLNELADYPPEALNQPPKPGKWSTLQTLEHLYLAESLTLKYVQKKLSYQPDLRPADWRTALKRFGLLTYTRIPIPVSAPKAVATDQFPASSDFAELRERYHRLRKETRAFLRQQNPEVLQSEFYRHPISGRLDVRGLILFFREHFRRHRRQIRRSVGKVGKEV